MKKLYNKKILILVDVLAIPLGFFCHWLTTVMLAGDRPCAWTLMGGQCLTCGGTHFVNSLLSGHISQAWHHNEFLFVLTVLLLLSWVLVHCHLLGHARWAAKVLRVLYSIPSLIVAVSPMIVFLILRNWPLFQQVWEILQNKA
jgi:hypothetical protein